MTAPRFGTAILAIGLAAVAAPAHAQAGRTVSFSKDVLPIFQKRCQLCHGVDSKGGLKLDSYENVMLGGTKGQDIMPGNPGASRLVQLVEARTMPPTGMKLTPIEIFTVRTWIQAGAKDDGSGASGNENAAKPLEITEPKEGATVREKVKIAVPRTAIPPQGFVALYIDGRFKVALAPPSDDEIAEKKMPADAPINYIWDTKAPLLAVQSNSAVQSDRNVTDGPHVIEIRSYKGNGGEAETVQCQVNVKNQIEYVSNKPVKLWYGLGPSQVGQQWMLEHTVDLQATSGSSGPRGFGAGAAPAAAGPEKISHLETSKYLVSLEDVVEATGTGFWRERRESPIVVTVDNQKKVVRLDTSSRYYSMERTGEVRKTKVMERESREPILNPIDLPGRPQRMNETFTTNLRINLGAYIPASLKVDRLQATLEGIEWFQGESCVRIRLTYLAGTAKVDIKSVNISGADFEIESGTSTVWFSEATQRVLKVEHDVVGNLSVDVAQLSGGGAGGYPGGGMGGEFAPGMVEGAMAPPGGAFGAPGGYPGGGAPAFGAPFGGGGYPGGAAGRGGYPGGAPGGRGGYPGGSGGYPGGSGGYPGGGRPTFGSPFAGSGGGYPGGGYPGGGYPGGFSGGAPMFGGAPSFGGTSGGYPGGYPGGGADPSLAPQKKRYHVNLKVKTRVLEPEEIAAKKSQS